jgi:Raf kinase inhibitor-like YbhB/YbcL family protein
MKPRWLYLFVLFSLFSFTAIESLGGETMQLSSAAFQDGGRIPIQYVMPGAGGKNVSVQLGWTNPPAETKSFALSIVDPHPVAKNWAHWLVINIPAQTTSLWEGASKKTMPPGAVELKNSFGDVGYGGPQPPSGTGEHPYVVTLYALSVEKLALDVNTNLAAFNKALEGKVLTTAEITGMYSR